MDTKQKIQGLQDVANENFHNPLETPIVSSTATKGGNIVQTLINNGHIDNMTYRWLSSGQNPPQIPEFYTLTKIHKNIPVGRPIVSGNGSQTERISSFVDSLLQPIAQKQESYIKTLPTLSTSLKTLHFPTKRFQLPSTFVHSTLIFLRRREYYQEHYQSETPIPTPILEDLM